MILKVVVVKKRKSQRYKLWFKRKTFYGGRQLLFRYSHCSGIGRSDDSSSRCSMAVVVVTVVVVVEAVVVVVVEVISHSKAGQRNFMNENFL